MKDSEFIICDVSVKVTKSLRLIAPAGLSKSELERMINENMNAKDIIESDSYNEGELRIKNILIRDKFVGCTSSFKCDLDLMGKV